MKPRSVAALLLSALILALGCTRKPSGEPPAASSGAAEVKTTKPAPRTLVRKIEEPGQVAPYERAPLYPRVTGYVRALGKDANGADIDIGSRVKMNDLLLIIDVPDLRAEYEQKKAWTLEYLAEIRQAETSLGIMAAQQRRADAELKRATSEFDRLKNATQGVSPQVRFEVEAALEMARAGVTESEARQVRAVADVTAAWAKFRVAQAEEERLAAMVGFAEIRAPFDGVVTKRNVDPGHLVQPSGKGEPLLEVAWEQRPRIYIEVPETESPFIPDNDMLRKQPMKAVVTVQALPGEKLPATVKRSSYALEGSGRTLRTEIEAQDKRLRPGMYVRAAILVERSVARAVPLTAVTTQGEQSSLWIVENGKAVRWLVQTGFRDGSHVEVLKKKRPDAGEWQDFSGAEDVIVVPPVGLADGQAVSTGGGQ
jgi:RND family efflux transporter MFP subunit